MPSEASESRLRGTRRGHCWDASAQHVPRITRRSPQRSANKILDTPAASTTLPGVKEEVWRIVHGTGGRPITIPLPDDLTDDQIAWIKSHMPRGCRLVPPGERATDIHYEREMDGALESLRDVTAQITEKRIELIKLEQELSRVKVDLEREKMILEERRKHARSFGSALTELVEQLGGKIKI